MFLCYITASMALTEKAKMRKAQVLAVAVQILRKERLKLSQPDFAELVGGKCDEGSVSRWERGSFAPNPAKRKRLAAIARKNGSGDLVSAFEDSMHEWRQMLLSERDRHWLALFELILLNQPGRDEYLFPVVPRKELARLIKAFRAVVRATKKHDFRPGSRLGDGTLGYRGMWMVTDEQVAAWQWETQPYAVRQIKRARCAPANSERVVLRFYDGRVEVFENWAAMNRAIARYRAEAEREERDGK